MAGASRERTCIETTCSASEVLLTLFLMYLPSVASAGGVEAVGEAWSSDFEKTPADDADYSYR